MDLPANHPHAPPIEKPIERPKEPYRDAAIHEAARVKFEQPKGK